MFNFAHIEENYFLPCIFAHDTVVGDETWNAINLIKAGADVIDKPGLALSALSIDNEENSSVLGRSLQIIEDLLLPYAARCVGIGVESVRCDIIRLLAFIATKCLI
jgi:hypothetical protein